LTNTRLFIIAYYQQIDHLIVDTTITCDATRDLRS